MYLRLTFCLFASIILIACSDIDNEIEPRTWTDVQGRTMEAKLIGVDLDNNEVVFLKNTGKRYRYQINRLSNVDQRYIHKKKDTLPNLINPLAERERTEFEKALTQNLIQFVRGRIDNLNEADFQAKEYYAIYYSAHWCPPCRKFTPQLVSFYNSYARKYDNFEIIFVSNDRNENDMKSYMKETNMPWPALEFARNKKGHPATKYSGRGIPCLVLLDNKGSVLAHSYVGNRYIGPNTVMDKLKETLDQSSKI